MHAATAMVYAPVSYLDIVLLQAADERQKTLLHNQIELGFDGKNNARK